jgi:hypothetical protein
MSEKPRTSRRFPTTLPVSDPRTTSVRPAETAKSAMMSSGAFPNVAFRNPPIPGPTWWAASSVASPISQASGMSAAAARTKRAVSPIPMKLSTITIGPRPSDAQRILRAKARIP